MRDSKDIGPYLVLFSVVGASLYCIFTYISAMFYPQTFGPLETYLSVLGNSSLNPDGALYYNLGVISAGLSLIPFYIGLFVSRKDTSYSHILVVALLAGIINCISIIMSGVFSEDVYDLHFFWSLMIFLSWIPLLLLTNGVLIQMQGAFRGTGVYGMLLGLFDSVFVAYVIMFGSDEGSILEWVTIFAFLGWAALLAFVTWREK